MLALINYTDKTTGTLSLASVTNGNVESFVLDKESLDWKNIAHIDFAMNNTDICAGEDGFYLLSGTSTDCRESSVGYFRQRQDI